MLEQLQGLNIFLIGMMGSGKSTVGQVLAEQLGYRFFDADVVIERVSQRPITAIFQDEGEVAFRALESQVLGELAAQTRSVIATGGGIVLQRVNWSFLHHGAIVWLDAPLPVLVERLEADTSRPLLQTSDLAQTLGELLEKREFLYAEADLRIAVSADLSPLVIARDIIQQLPRIIKNPQA